MKLINFLSNPDNLSLFALLAMQTGSKHLHWAAKDAAAFSFLPLAKFRSMIHLLASFDAQNMPFLSTFRVPESVLQEDLMQELFDQSPITRTRTVYSILPQELFFNLVPTEQITEQQTLSLHLQYNSSVKELSRIANILAFLRHKPLYKFFRHMDDTFYSATELVALTKQHGNNLRKKGIYDSLLPSLLNLNPEDRVLEYNTSLVRKKIKGRPTSNRFRIQFSRIRLRFMTDPILQFNLREMNNNLVVIAPRPY